MREMVDEGDQMRTKIKWIQNVLLLLAAANRIDGKWWKKVKQEVNVTVRDSVEKGTNAFGHLFAYFICC